MISDQSLPPPRSPADEVVELCIAGRTRLLNRVVTAFYDDALRSVGIRNTQLMILALISRDPAIGAGELEERLQADRSTISRNLKRMRNYGWIEATPGEDARRRNLMLTDAGREIFERAIPIWREAQLEITAILGPDAQVLVTQSEVSWRKARFRLKEVQDLTTFVSDDELGM